MKFSDQLRVVDFSRKWLSTHNGAWPMGWGFERLAGLIAQEISITIRPATLREYFKSANLPYPSQHMTRTVDAKNRTRSQLLRLQKALVELYGRLGESIPVYLTQGFPEE